MNTFCTYFDHNYLANGLTLYFTLKKYCPNATLHVLALSQQCTQILYKWNLPDLHITALSELENYNPELLTVKNTRSKVEYFFTLSPYWPLYLLEKNSNIELLTYLDADCALFSDPTPALEEMRHLSIGFVGHRFPERLNHLFSYGRYNVGWLSFKADANSLACLNWWRQRCFEWCYDRLERDRYADQKYLDSWPELFQGVSELAYKGINVAPWNIDRFVITKHAEEIYVDDSPLICYHFHNCKPVTEWLWSIGCKQYGSSVSAVLRNHVYKPYIQQVKKYRKLLRHVVLNQDSNLRCKAGKVNVDNIQRMKSLYTLFRNNDLIFVK